MAKRLYVDSKRCSKCGLCVDEYPQAFRMTQEGWAEAFNQDALTLVQIEDAVGLCPAECIHYE